MVHHAFENLFRTRARHFLILGFGIALLTSQSTRLRFVRRALVFNRPPEKLPSGRLIRPRPLLARRLAGRILLKI